MAWCAQKGADDRSRETFGDVAHDITPARGHMRVKQLGDDLNDQLLQACGGAGGVNALATRRRCR
jgi:hypothetical protein